MKSRSAIFHFFRMGGLTLVFGLLCILPSFGQGDIDQLTTKDFHFGPKAGVHITNLYNSAGPLGARSRIGYAGGGFVHYRIIPMLAASVEIQYQQLGSDTHFGISLNNFGSDAGSNIITHNLDAPVLLHVYAPTTGSIQPKLLAGAAFTYNFFSQVNSYRNINIGGTSSYPTLIRENRTGEFNPFEIGILAGAGIDTMIGDLMIAVDLRYRFGLYNVTDIVSNAVVNEDSSVFRGWMLNVGVGF